MTTAVGNGREHTETTVCVTGATGFLASWLVKRLLDKGYTVHATVRDPGNEVKVRPLLDISGAAERLKLFKADLSEDGSFDAAVAGCQGVFHVATPIDFTPKDPENDVIKPAINGTLNVLKSCTKAQTVKRVVVTSSAATVSINESTEQNQELDESSWTDLDFLQTKKPPTWSYAVSKTLAEQAALQYGKEQGLDVVTIVRCCWRGPPSFPTCRPVSTWRSPCLLAIPTCSQAIKGMQLLSKQALGEVDQEILDTQVNPAVWEISGHIVLKRKQDFDRASEDYAWKLLAEVSLSEERFEEVEAYILEAVAIGEVQTEEKEEASVVEDEDPLHHSLKNNHDAPVHLNEGCLVLP